VFARGARRIEPSYAEADDVDTAMVTLAHADGCLTAIDNSRRAAYGYDQRVEVFGSLGMASSHNPLQHTGALQTAEGTRLPGLPHFFLERYVPSYVREWNAFVDAVRTGSEPVVGPADARAPLVIGLAARRSMHERRPVAIAEIEAGEGS
jgi:myo-inositol 2-dehydrogenase/D-chiro-inositol 1-dehydrogenase